MIRKRKQKSEPYKEQNIQVQKNNSQVREQAQQKETRKPIEFKTYREEACYVLDLLEKQGVNIYEEGRYGGMYLNRHSGGKFNHIFSNTKNNKKQENTQQINNEKLDNNELSKLFGLK